MRYHESCAVFVPAFHTGQFGKVEVVGIQLVVHYEEVALVRIEIFYDVFQISGVGGHDSRARIFEHD